MGGCPSGTGMGHFPPHSCLPIVALVVPAPGLPLAFSFVFKFSGAFLDLTPAQPWPLPQRASDLSPLNSVGTLWSLLFDAVHPGKPNLACPVTFCASVISRSCLAIGSGKEENCSLTGPAGKWDIVKMSVWHFPWGHGPGHAFQLEAPIPPTTTETSAAECVRHLERAPRAMVLNQRRFAPLIAYLTFPTCHNWGEAMGI